MIAHLEVHQAVEGPAVRFLYFFPFRLKCTPIQGRADAGRIPAPKTSVAMAQHNPAYAAMVEGADQAWRGSATKLKTGAFGKTMFSRPTMAGIYRIYRYRLAEGPERHARPPGRLLARAW